MKTVFHTRNDELTQDNGFYFIYENTLSSMELDGNIEKLDLPVSFTLIDDKVLEYAKNFKYNKPTLNQVENFIHMGDERGYLQNGEFIDVVDTEYGASTPVESNLLLAVYHTALYLFENKNS